MVTLPPPRRVLVNLDNIEFYRPQLSKSLRSEPSSATATGPYFRPVLPLPVTLSAPTLREITLGSNRAPSPTTPHEQNSETAPARPIVFNIKIAKFAKPTSPEMSSQTHSAFAQEGTGGSCLIPDTVTPFMTPFTSGEETDLASPFEGTVIRPSIELSTEPKSLVSSPITPVSNEQPYALLTVILTTSPILDAFKNVISDDAHVSMKPSELGRQASISQDDLSIDDQVH
ncbi:hypothetical protein Asppvi_005761 [Aspergillus pseudoviridinutans]|uniref:Uncharacterized protein n=1 Tax=Aspergillus pseudoviridinutans TaxID=1517512 RepID=A0A9P3BCX1_9EURO|nr:uncharacterized protein Asppvi_005761 [Aspergillus pseudoviridinutans]GIJ86863.1 hypothetical protein Asppvi_005761 [Aspergillus pseudoviridinutans]